MRKNMKLTSLLAIVTVMALLIGSLAFFTDRVTTSASATTMSNAVDIVPVDPGNNDTEIDLSNYWATVNADAIANYNPADIMNLSYDLMNAGSLAVTTRETIVVSTNKSIDAESVFTLCSEIQDGTYGGSKVKTALDVTPSADAKSYTYTVTNASLAAGSVADKAYFVVFNENAANTAQGATCTINYLVEALQADGDWATIATATLSNGTWSGGAPAA